MLMINDNPGRQNYYNSLFIWYFGYKNWYYKPTKVVQVVTPVTSSNFDQYTDHDWACLWFSLVCPKSYIWKVSQIRPWLLPSTFFPVGLNHYWPFNRYVIRSHFNMFLIVRQCYVYLEENNKYINAICWLVKTLC